jgi:hypothetical protein
MILDGVIIWIANSNFVPPDGLHGIKELLDFIISSDTQDSTKIQSNFVNTFNMKFSHPSLSIGFQLAILSQRIESDLFHGKTKHLDEFVESLQTPAQLRFGNHIQLFLRGIFLNKNVPTEKSMKVFDVLLEIVKGNQDVATGFLLPVLFKLSREKEPNAQLKLLRGITKFAVVKVNLFTVCRSNFKKLISFESTTTGQMIQKKTFRSKSNCTETSEIM